MSLSGRMQSLYDPATIVNGRFVAVAAPAGVGHERSYGAGSDSSRWPTMSARVMGRGGERRPQRHVAEPR
jgi:hypothetical protein